MSSRPTELAEVEALTFDVFGTVVDWRGGVAREVAAILGARGLERDWDAFARAWRERYQPAMEQVRSGRRPWTKLDDLHRENLIEVLDAFDITVADAAEIDHLNRAWHRLDPWPDVVAGLAPLKRRFILATLSNGNVALMVNMAKRAGLPWDVILGAEIARAYKPRPEAYLRAADMLGLAPRQCLMVAAHNADLAAARACGFRTAFIARPDENGREQARDARADPEVDLAASSMIELADRLGC